MQARRTLVVLAILAAVVCVTYWQAVRLPFISDDNWFIDYFQNTSPADVFANAFQISGKIIYRPLSQCILFQMYRLFGDNPVLFHILALFVHTLTSLLVALIMRRLTASQAVAYATAAIYAAAIAIHLDTLAWAVGLYDFGGAALFCLCLWLFIIDRWWLSALVFLVGYLFKESIIVAPAILAAYLVLMPPPSGRRILADRNWLRLLPFAAAIVTAVAIKLQGQSPLQLPARHPYVVSFDVVTFVTNVRRYLTWMSQALLPIPSASLLPGAVTLVAILIAGVPLLVSGLASPAQRGPARCVALLLIWTGVGLLPVIFLPNHSYRYYATYSLPAFVAFWLYAIRWWAQRAGLSVAAAGKVVCALAVLVVAGSVYQSNRIYREGVGERSFADGTNSPIRRGAYVDIVRSGLMRYLPHPPRGAVIVIAGADIWSFWKEYGPRYWYNDQSIQLFSIQDLQFKDGKPVIVGAAENVDDAYTGQKASEIPIDPARLFVFKVSAGTLTPVRWQDLMASAAN